MARLILDTGVLVAGARGDLDQRHLAGGDDVVLPAIVLAEYQVGVRLMTDPGRRARHDAYLAAIRAKTPVVDYTPEIAEHHAELLAHVRRLGVPRGSHDLIIAATARATSRILLTTDKRAHFGDLPDVTVRLIAP